MVRGPKSGNGTRSSVHNLDAAGFSPLRPRPRQPRALDSEIDPLAPGLLAGDDLDADPQADGAWSGAGGRWLLWPLRVVLWAALLVITFRGITAIVFSQTSAPAGGGPASPSTAGGQFPVTLAEAYAAAYASGDSAALSRFLVRGVSLTGLGGAVIFDSIAGLHVPPGGATRQITVTVIWQLPEQPGSAGGNLGMAPKLEMSYCMSVVDLQSGKWYVKEIGASTKAVGAR